MPAAKSCDDDGAEPDYLQLDTHHRLNTDWTYTISWMDQDTQKYCHGSHVVLHDAEKKRYTWNPSGHANGFATTSESLPGTRPLDVIVVQERVEENTVKPLRFPSALPKRFVRAERRYGIPFTHGSPRNRLRSAPQ